MRLMVTDAAGRMVALCGGHFAVEHVAVARTSPFQALRQIFMLKKKVHSTPEGNMAKKDKAAALYERIMGDVQKVTEFEIRWLIKGWTFEQLRAKIEQAMTEEGGIDRSTLFRWRADRCAPRSVFRDALLEVMDAETIEELGLGAAEDAVRNFTYMTLAERKCEVHRRQTLKALGGAAVGLLLPASPLVATAQLLDRHKSVGEDEVTAAQHTATVLAAAYRENPGKDSVRSAKAHAYTLVDHLRSGRVRPEAQAGLQAVASDAAALAGYAALNAGRLNNAKCWFDGALSLAREARDRRLEAHALGSFAALAWTQPVPDHEASVAALRSAARLQGSLPPAGRAKVFGGLGCELAAVGDDLASGRFLEEAREAAALIPFDQAGWGWWSIHGQLAGWDDIEPEVYEAGRSMWLGRPAEAVEVFRSVAERDRPVGRAGLLHHLMNSYAALGDLEGACGAATRALDLASAHGLGYIPAKIREARQAFPQPWNARLPLVRHLDERLALAS